MIMMLVRHDDRGEGRRVNAALPQMALDRSYGDSRLEEQHMSAGLNEESVAAASTRERRNGQAHPRNYTRLQRQSGPVDHLPNRFYGPSWLSMTISASINSETLLVFVEEHHIYLVYRQREKPERAGVPASPVQSPSAVL
jgi:hypothetical protein